MHHIQATTALGFAVKTRFFAEDQQNADRAHGQWILIYELGSSLIYQASAMPSLRPRRTSVINKSSHGSITEQNKIADATWPVMRPSRFRNTLAPMLPHSNKGRYILWATPDLLHPLALRSTRHLSNPSIIQDLLIQQDA